MSYFINNTSIIADLFFFTVQNGGYFDVILKEKLNFFKIITKYCKDLSVERMKELIDQYLFNYLESENLTTKTASYRKSFHYCNITNKNLNNINDHNWLLCESKLINIPKHVTVTNSIDAEKMTIEQCLNYYTTESLDKLKVIVIKDFLPYFNFNFFKNQKEFDSSSFYKSICFDDSLKINLKEEKYYTDQILAFDSKAPQEINLRPSKFIDLLNNEKLEKELRANICEVKQDYKTFQEKFFKDNLGFFKDIDSYVNNRNHIIHELLAQHKIFDQNDDIEIFKNTLNSTIEIRGPESWNSSINKETFLLFNELIFNIGIEEVMFIITKDLNHTELLKDKLTKDYIKNNNVEMKEKSIFHKLPNVYIPTLYYLMNNIEVFMVYLKPGEALLINAGSVYSNITMSNKPAILLKYKMFNNDYKTFDKLIKIYDQNNYKQIYNTEFFTSLPLNNLIIQNLNYNLPFITYHLLDLLYYRLKENYENEKAMYDKILLLINRKEISFNKVNHGGGFSRPIVDTYCFKCKKEVVNFYSYCSYCCDLNYNLNNQLETVSSASVSTAASVSLTSNANSTSNNSKGLINYKKIFCLGCFQEHNESNQAFKSDLEKENRNLVLKKENCTKDFGNYMCISFKWKNNILDTLLNRCCIYINHEDEKKLNDKPQDEFFLSKNMHMNDEIPILEKIEKITEEIKQKNSEEALLQNFLTYSAKTSDFIVDKDFRDKLKNLKKKIICEKSLFNKMNLATSVNGSLLNIYKDKVSLYIDYIFLLDSIEKDVNKGLDYIKMEKILDNPSFSPVRESKNNANFNMFFVENEKNIEEAFHMKDPKNDVNSFESIFDSGKDNNKDGKPTDKDNNFGSFLNNINFSAFNKDKLGDDAKSELNFNEDEDDKDKDKLVNKHEEEVAQIDNKLLRAINKLKNNNKVNFNESQIIDEDVISNNSKNSKKKEVVGDDEIKREIEQSKLFLSALRDPYKVKNVNTQFSTNLTFSTQLRANLKTLKDFKDQKKIYDELKIQDFLIKCAKNVGLLKEIKSLLNETIFDCFNK